MEYQWRLVFLLAFLNAACCFQLDQNTCQSNAGAHLKQYENTALGKIPFETSHVTYYLECVMKCKSIGECLSLNVKYIDDLIACELLDGDSRNNSMEYEENSTYYEFTKGTDWQGTPIAKNYCEPECKPVSPCSGLVDKCSCNKGSLVPIQKSNGGIVSVGTKDDKYGTVQIDVESGSYKIKLVYKSGYVTCVKSQPEFRSRFGCDKAVEKQFGIVITDLDGSVLLSGNDPQPYWHDGNNTMSSFITFTGAVNLVKGTTLQIWYANDFDGKRESLNDGTAEYYVLAWKQD